MEHFLWNILCCLFVVKIDVVAKNIISYLDSEISKPKEINIKKLGFIIQKHFDSIQEKNVCFFDDLELTSWENWSYLQYLDKRKRICYNLSLGAKTPYWWTAYNQVKHERTSRCENKKINCRANLKNVISAMAALFILETLFIKRCNHGIEISFTESNLFKMKLTLLFCKKCN